LLEENLLTVGAFQHQAPGRLGEKAALSILFAGAGKKMIGSLQHNPHFFEIIIFYRTTTPLTKYS
jgi:hypothetical protein